MSKGGIVFCYRSQNDLRARAGVRKSTPLTPGCQTVAQCHRHLPPWPGVAEEEGADAVSLVNTFRAMAINIHSRKPELGNVFGGLSGPAIKPIALTNGVGGQSQAVKIPVIGMGGITKAEDAIEFVLAGASAIQIGTANLVHPTTGIEVVHGIRKYLAGIRFACPRLIGLFKP